MSADLRRRTSRRLLAHVEQMSKEMHLAKDEENQKKDEEHKTEIAKKDEQMLAKDAELARLKARLATAEEGVPPPSKGK